MSGSPYQGGRGQPPRQTEDNSGGIDSLIPGGTPEEQNALSQWMQYWQPDEGYRYAQNPLIPVKQKVLDAQGHLGAPELTWPSAVRDPVRAMLDVFQGFRSGTVSPETTQTIAGLTINPMGRMVPGQLGVFAGIRARSALIDKAVKAETMERLNVPAMDIWQKTGWFKGRDGEWRFEIPDSDATLHGLNLRAGDNLTLGEVLDHPALFKAYPKLKDLPVKMTEGGANYGMYNPANGGSMELMGGRPPEQMLSTAMHETQHAIQDIEGFHPGGSVEGIYFQGHKPGNYDVARDMYRGIYGEVEARNVQNRLLNPDQRQIYPRATEDTARPILKYLQQEPDKMMTYGSATVPMKQWPTHVYYTPIDEDPWAGGSAGLPGTAAAADRRLPHEKPPAESSAMTDPAYHGTPHEITGNFDDSKMGTGEGFQAFGWGHYLAGNPGVAKYYKDKLSYPEYNISHNGQNVKLPTGVQPQSIHEALDQLGVDKSPWVRDVITKGREQFSFAPSHYGDKPDNAIREQIATHLNDPLLYDEGHDALVKLQDQLASGKFSFGYGANEGNLYQVKIHPEEDELLHRDLPLGEQPKVMVKLKAARAKLPHFQEGNERLLGSEYYDQITQWLGQPKLASKALDAAGVPGLRFWDQNSRGHADTVASLKASIAERERDLQTTHGELFRQQIQDSLERLKAELAAVPERKLTHNYVMFDPRHISLTHKNGTPLEPIDHDPFAGGK